MQYSEDDDSQTGFVSDPLRMSKAELRKTNKPIMEKKRRARINNCLNELKDILFDAKDNDPRHSKLEKADILEMAVKHLQSLQRQQLAAAIAADPAVLHRFRAGFGDCAGEVRRYLSRLAHVPTGIRHRVGAHLDACIAGVERLHAPERAQLVPDPLRLGERSAFRYVSSTRPTSPPLSPLSCDSACDSSTELDTPPRPPPGCPYPTPPSRSASDQDSSPEAQTVSSTTPLPEVKATKVMEPLSIVIDVENYKIGIDASPKRPMDYSLRHRLKRAALDHGPAQKVMRIETESERSSLELVEDRPAHRSSAFQIRISERVSSFPERLDVPEEQVCPAPRLAHTAAVLAQSSVRPEAPGPGPAAPAPAAPSPEPPQGSSEMWRPW